MRWASRPLLWDASAILLFLSLMGLLRDNVTANELTKFTDAMVPDAMRGRMVVGSPDRIAEAVAANVVDVGIDGVIVNLPGYVPGSIAAVGEALRPIVG